MRWDLRTEFYRALSPISSPVDQKHRRYTQWTIFQGEKRSSFLYVFENTASFLEAFDSKHLQPDFTQKLQFWKFWKRKRILRAKRGVPEAREIASDLGTNGFH